LPNTRFQKRLEFSAKNTEKIYTLLNQIDNIKSQWKVGKKISPQLISKLQQSVLISSAGSSTRIEGSKLSNEEVEKLLKKFHIKKFKTRDEQEVAGYLELLKKVFDTWQSIPFSESIILSFHKELLKYSEKDKRHRGIYKFTSNRVEARDQSGKLIGIVFDPTPSHLVAKEMQELAEWTKQALENQKKHSLLIAANFFFEFLAIHPFQDGNGRCSRILTNFLLMKLGYEYMPLVSHEKLVEENKVDYYLALNKTQKTWKTKKEDLSPWILFFLQMVLEQSELALDIFNQESVELFLSEKQTQVWRFVLSKNIFSKSEVVLATGLKPRMVEEALKKFLQMRKIEKIGQGSATRYQVIG
jgi:Fic family protein